MLKCNLLVHLGLLLLIFTLFSQCKVKSGAKRAAPVVEVLMASPKPEPRPESKPEPRIGDVAEIYYDREDVKYSEVIKSEPNSFTSSGVNGSKAVSSRADKGDSSGKAINDDKAGVKATLGISYFNSIRQYETKDLRVSAIFNGDANLVRKKIRDIEAVEYEYVPKQDSSTIRVIKDITLFKKLKITLHYDKADFTITPVPDDAKDEQELDFESGNNWHWTVRAVADKPHPAIVKVEIFGENHKGDLKLIALKEVEIKIDILQTDSFWSKVRQWPGDHLDYVIESMLVPLVIYLWSRRKKKKVV